MEARSATVLGLHVDHIKCIAELQKQACHQFVTFFYARLEQVYYHSLLHLMVFRVHFEFYRRINIHRATAQHFSEILFSPVAPSCLCNCNQTRNMNIETFFRAVVISSTSYDRRSRIFWSLLYWSSFRPQEQWNTNLQKYQDGRGAFMKRELFVLPYLRLIESALHFCLYKKPHLFNFADICGLKSAHDLNRERRDSHWLVRTASIVDLLDALFEASAKRSFGYGSDISIDSTITEIGYCSLHNLWNGFEIPWHVL